MLPHASRVAQTQSPRGKLARSGTPERKSAISRGGGCGRGGGSAGAECAPIAARVAEPTWLVR
jgi:hypothetical protein